MSTESDLPSNLVLLRQTPLVKGLHTLIRDKASSRHTFVTSSDRLVQLLVEEALGHFPSTPVSITTPCGTYEGTSLLDPHSSLCAISILRAADCMLGVVRALMPSIAVGKVLIQRDEATALAQLLYSKLPPDIANRHILLLDPMLATGGSAIACIELLVSRGVAPSRIIFVNILCVREGLEAIASKFPDIKVVSSALDPILNGSKYIVPGLGDFGDRYFGTEDV